MSDREHITLPREVVEDVLYALVSEQNQGGDDCYADSIAALRAALAAEPTKQKFDHSIGAERFKVVRGTFWWHVKIGDSPTEHGKFRSSEAAQKMADDLLREFRNGAFVQNALAAPRLEVTVDPRLTAEEAAAISSAIDARKKEQSDDLKVMNEALRILTKRESGDLRWQVSDACDILRTAVRKPRAAPSEDKTHPGYVIGSHWLETAYSRVCAGEAEADVLRDCGWERVDEALRRDAERWRHWRDSHGFATIEHEGGRCFVTLISDCDDPDQVRAKRFAGEDSFEWLDAFTDAAMGEKR